MPTLRPQLLCAPVAAPSANAATAPESCDVVGSRRSQKSCKRDTSDWISEEQPDLSCLGPTWCLRPGVEHQRGRGALSATLRQENVPKLLLLSKLAILPVEAPSECTCFYPQAHSPSPSSTPQFKSPFSSPSDSFN